MGGASLGSQTQAFGVLSPQASLGFGRGRFELCALPVLSFSQLEGLSFIPSPIHSGSSDALSEFTNGYDRVESGSIVHDGVGIAL